MNTFLWAIIGIVVVVLFFLAIKIVRQWERGVLLRFGKMVGVRNPGFNLIVPIVDRLVKVDLRIVTMVLEPQEIITKDNVTIKVTAVVYFQVVDPVKAVINIEAYDQATIQIALTSLRSVLGQSELDELLAHRERINDRLRTIIEEQTEKPWGVRVTIAEVKDVLLPDSMQRAMARQAEAERERRAKVIHAQGEFAAAQTLADAAKIIQSEPAALQLRYLQTLTEIAGEKSNTIIPLPLDILGLKDVLLGKKEKLNQ
ncbi:MAG: band 7 protein [Dehalococcoidia bacterium]|nr:band 7 protein [Dehalococcoidia bacterium]MBF8303876.1 band 7 protein [Dehalococcoidia bacterium]